MSQAYLGEIRAFGFNFAPHGWMQCNGQTLSVTQYSDLFSIIGTIYGGNGTTNFMLPNLQGQIPMHWGSGPSVPTTIPGQVQGQTQVALAANQIPQHTHSIFAASASAGAVKSAIPTNTSFISEARGSFVYQVPPVTSNSPFSPKAISPNGGSQAHDNMQPYLALNFCIAVTGVFPPRG
jgi:microcystin-dependent protein